MAQQGKIILESKWKDIPLKIFENGIETIYFISGGHFQKSHYVLRTKEDIEVIYPYQITLINKGFQIETVENEVALIAYTQYAKIWETDIIPALKQLFDINWKNIFKEKSVLTKKKVGIHHNWTYHGFIKGWK